MSTTQEQANQTVGETAPPEVIESLPKDHLDHPEQWATGEDPATDKQKGFIGVLASKAGQEVDTSNLGKSEASVLINDLKNGKDVTQKEKNGDEKSETLVDRDANGAKKSANASEEQQTAETKQNGSSKDANTDTQETKEAEKTSDESAEKAEETQSAKSQSKTNKVDLTESKQSTESKQTTESNQTNGTATESEIQQAAKQLEQEQSGKENAAPKRKADVEDEPTSTDDKTKKAKTDKENSMPTPAENSAKNASQQPGTDAYLEQPQKWATGAEAATDKQKGFVAVLADKAGQQVDTSDLTKTEASEKIQQLQT